VSGVGDWDVGERRRGRGRAARPLMGKGIAPQPDSPRWERGQTDERPRCFRARWINIRGSRDLFFFVYEIDGVLKGRDGGLEGGE
jgi:hypothetical protein